jgi:manganese/zinc/iron transport system permease protein
MIAAFDWQGLVRVLSLSDYNTRVVVLGTVALGIAAGLIGCFTLLRKRALVGDALAHATLPGIALAFAWGAGYSSNGKSLVLLLIGAAGSGLLGVAGIGYLRYAVRLREDAALGIVLSVFFGAGVALIGVLQKVSNRMAGLEAYIYGKAASMVALEAWVIFATAVMCIVVTSLLFKEWKILCFDEGFAGSRGYPTKLLDVVLMTVVVLVTIVGIKAVGLVLMIALLIIPAVSARFWTDQLGWLTIVSAGIGATSCFTGALLSAFLPRLPSGPMIVLVAAGMFAVSFAVGRKRGLLVRSMRRIQMDRRMEREHLLREMFEHQERSQQTQELAPISVDKLLAERSWGRRQLNQAIERAARDEYVRRDANHNLVLTARGMTEAARLAREHRLWELYLITHADVAPSRVDHEADRIEHVLEPELIAELEMLLGATPEAKSVPPNPHSPF